MLFKNPSLIFCPGKIKIVVPFSILSTLRKCVWIIFSDSFNYPEYGQNAWALYKNHGSFWKMDSCNLRDHLLLVFLLINENLTWCCYQLSVFWVLREKTVGKTWKNVSKWGCKTNGLRIANYLTLSKNQTLMLYAVWSRMMQLVCFFFFPWDLRKCVEDV